MSLNATLRDASPRFLQQRHNNRLGHAAKRKAVESLPYPEFLRAIQPTHFLAQNGDVEERTREQASLPTWPDVSALSKYTEGDVPLHDDRPSRRRRRRRVHEGAAARPATRDDERRRFVGDDESTCRRHLTVGEHVSTVRPEETALCVHRLDDSSDHERAEVRATAPRRLREAVRLERDARDRQHLRRGQRGQEHAQVPAGHRTLQVGSQLQVDRGLH